MTYIFYTSCYFLTTTFNNFYCLKLSQNRSLLKRKEPPVQEPENNLSPTIEQTSSSQPPLVKFQRFQSAWDPTKIHSQTLFVLATRANKVNTILQIYCCSVLCKSFFFFFWYCTRERELYEHNCLPYVKTNSK